MAFKSVKSPPEYRDPGWRRIIGEYSMLPENHPVIHRLTAAGMGPDIKLREI
jgi:hypothetical protein